VGRGRGGAEREKGKRKKGNELTTVPYSFSNQVQYQGSEVRYCRQMVFN